MPVSDSQSAEKGFALMQPECGGIVVGLLGFPSDLVAEAEQSMLASSVKVPSALKPDRVT
jgi:hypothetical protein